MKLQTIRLSNFQSFGAATTEIRLEKITYLIGPNASGKTAALQALFRLSALIRQCVESCAGMHNVLLKMNTWAMPSCL